jgi:DNA-binding transcriptional MerR regulator
LRYYERAGLLDRIPRDRGGRSRYTATDLDRVVFLQRMRRTGMPIRLLREYIELARLGEVTSARRAEILENHRADMFSRLEDLRAAIAVCDGKIAGYRGESVLSRPRLDIF